jgi:hypothetical protein
VPENWDPNLVPSGLADTAVITNSGTYTVTLGSGLAIASIILGAADSAGIQTLSWGGGTLSDCSVRIAANGVLDLNGSVDKSEALRDQQRRNHHLVRVRPDDRRGGRL